MKHHRISQLAARDIVRLTQSGQLSVLRVADAFLEVIAQREASIHAWEYLSPEQVRTQARALDASRDSCGNPLHGVPVGIKDLFDTRDLPTGYGSRLYRDHRPRRDAACVASIRSHGGLVMGKTVTTEFAGFAPGKTVNPAGLPRAVHTPGGSSSGSAAAVAAGMVPLAVGTQTAGSIIRPAAFCGVVGFKPTFGAIPAAGVKPLSPSLDTVGVFARDVQDAAFFAGLLMGRALPTVGGRLRLGLLRSSWDSAAQAEAVEALEHAARAWCADGGAMSSIQVPPHFSELNAAQQAIMEYEACACFLAEDPIPAKFSRSFSEMLQRGAGISGATYAAHKILVERCSSDLADIFRDVDVLLAMSALGSAPAGLESTGDPLPNRSWTALGCPCLHVPKPVSNDRLPIGVTLIGPRWKDGQVTAAAAGLEAAWAKAGGL